MDSASGARLLTTDDASQPDPVLRKRTRASSATEGASPPVTAQWAKLTQAPPKAIRNLGNTCYMTVVLQAIFACPHIRSFFLAAVIPEVSAGEENSIDGDAGMQVLQALDTLFQVYCSDAPKLIPGQLVIAAQDFLPILRGCGQQDAHEFLHVLFEVFDRVTLHADPTKCGFAATSGTGLRAFSQCRCDPPPLHATLCRCQSNGGESRLPTLASHTFGGVLQSDVTCSCGNVSSRSEPFLDLSIDVGTHVATCSEDPQRRSDDAVDELTTLGLTSRAPSGEAASACSAGAAPDVHTVASRGDTSSPDPMPQLSLTPRQSPSCNQDGSVIGIKCEWASDGEREGTLFLTPDGTPEGTTGDLSADGCAFDSRGRDVASREASSQAERRRAVTSTSPADDASDGQAPAAATLRDALQRLVHAEAVADYACEHCHSSSAACKQLSLRQLPLVLIVHAKRFRHGVKLAQGLQFPVQQPLDMAPYTAIAAGGGACEYRLDCVIEHIGRRLHGGHYVAYVRQQGGWHKCDDQKIVRVSVATVEAAQAYMLFYTFLPPAE